MIYNSDSNPNATASELCLRQNAVGGRTGELLPKFRRWRSIAVAQAQFKFTNITPTGIASTSAPSTSGCCVKPKPLIASCQSALSAAMCACAQFCKLAGCSYDLCQHCCDALANEAKVVGEDIPSCIAHQPDGVSTSLASFSLKGCVTSTVSLRVHLREFLQSNAGLLRQTLQKYLPARTVHRFQLVLWMDGFSTLGPHLWAACVTFSDDFMQLVPTTTPSELQELSCEKDFSLCVHLSCCSASWPLSCAVLLSLPVVMSDDD